MNYKRSFNKTVIKHFCMYNILQGICKLSESQNLHAVFCVCSRAFVYRVYTRTQV